MTELHEKWNGISEKISIYQQKSEGTPAQLLELLITAEDHRFWTHYGVDLIAMVRAAYRTIILKRLEGGSTIAMQLVRTISGEYQISLKRKLVEIYLAYKVTQFFDKQTILGCYLDMAYFGWKMNGIRTASQRLGYNIDHLSIEEAALIIARLKYPEPRMYSLNKANLIQRRAKYIMSRNNKLKMNSENGTVYSTSRTKKTKYTIS